MCQSLKEVPFAVNGDTPLKTYLSNLGRCLSKDEKNCPLNWVLFWFLKDYRKKLEN